MDQYIEQIKAHPDYGRVGMILCHQGVVRQTSGKNGQKVTGLQVAVDHQRLDRLVAEYKQAPGIVEILVDIVENKALQVGEDIMVLVVAGDTRQRVIAALSDLLDAIKTQVTKKVEYPAKTAE